MATVHTAYGPGEIVDRETVRGRTQYKVAGDGFEVWIDEAKLGAYERPDTIDTGAAHWDGYDLGDKLDGSAFGPGDSPLGEGYDRPGFGLDDIKQYKDYLRHHDYYEGEDELARFSSRREAWAPLDRDNSTELPYDPSPQHDAVGQSGHDDGSSTIQPIHHIDADERTSPSDSITFEDEEDSGEPGPNPDLFAKHGAIPPPALRHKNVYPKLKFLLGPDAANAAIIGLENTSVGHGLNAAQGTVDRAISTVAPGEGWGDLIKGGSVHEANPAALLAPALLRAVGPAIARGVGGAAVNGLVNQGAEAAEEFAPGEGWGDLVKETSYRPAGLSDRYIDLTASVDYHNDPVAQFRHDPDAYINRIGHLMDEGLNPRFAEYMDLVEADGNVRTAAWKDVRAKAVRLKREGAVHVKDLAPSRIMASVDGDHGTYDVVILKGATVGDQSIANWHCGCEWGKWAFKRKFSYVGRLCSHAYASYLTMQSAAVKGQPRQKRGPSDMVIVKRNPRDRQYHMPVFAAGLKTADNLQEGPQRLTPDMVVNDTDDAHMFWDVTTDERDDTGPDDVVSEKDIVHFARIMRECEITNQPYPRQLVAFLSRYAACGCDGDCNCSSDDRQSDYQAHDATDANAALGELRADADHKQSDNLGNMADRVHQIQDAVEKARDNGADASRFVAQVRKVAAPEYGGSGGDPGANAYAEKGGITYMENADQPGTYSFQRTQGDGVNRNTGGDPGLNAYSEKGGITYMENADQPGTYSFQRSYPDGKGGTTTQKPQSGGDQATNTPGGGGAYAQSDRRGKPRPGTSVDPALSQMPTKSAPSGSSDPDAGKDLSGVGSNTGTGGNAGTGGNDGKAGDGAGKAGDGGGAGTGSAQTSGNVADGGVAGAENGNNAAITKNSPGVDADGNYTVGKGDTWTDIAQRATGDMNNYQKMYDLNKGVAGDNIDSLAEGTKINIKDFLNDTGNGGVGGDKTNPAGGGADGNIATPEKVDTSAVGGTSNAAPPAPGSTAPDANAGSGTNPTPAAPLAAEAGGTQPGVNPTSATDMSSNTSGSLTDPGLSGPGQKLTRRQAAPTATNPANPADPNQGQNGQTNTTAPSTQSTRPGQAGGNASLESDTYTDPTSAAQGIQGGDSLRSSPSGAGGTSSAEPGTSGGGRSVGDMISGAGDMVGNFLPGVGGIMNGVGNMVNTFSDMASNFQNAGGGQQPAAGGAQQPGAGAGGGGQRAASNIFASQADFDDWVRYAYPTVEGEGKLEPHTHPFAGSGWPGPLEIGTSEEYADKARKKADDVTDLGEGDLTKPMGEWQKQGTKRVGQEWNRSRNGPPGWNQSDFIENWAQALSDHARKNGISVENIHEALPGFQEIVGGPWDDQADLLLDHIRQHGLSPEGRRPRNPMLEDDEVPPDFPGHDGREASVSYSTDDDSDIVRAFQAHLGDTALGAGAGQGAGRFDDIAGAAQGFLRTAGRNYSLAEQSELIREGDKGGARNLGSLDLSGTHYEDMTTLGW